MLQRQFRYRRLRSSVSTRVARIQPGTGYQGIEIELIEAFPSGPHDYVALSYRWGDAAKDKAVTCNNCRLAITESLLVALRRFRDPEKVVTMWIDQLCIDQGNNKERSSQVSMMGTIYKQAQKVIVWLGEDNEHSNAGLVLAHQILALVDRDPSTRFEWKSIEDSATFPKGGHKRWKALASILRRPWFMRMWVIQEVVLSTNIDVAVGPEIFTWEEMGRIVGYLESPEYKVPNIKNEEIVTELPFSRINRIKLQNQEVGRPDLFDLLLVCRDFGASNPRDKIYALLGLGHHSITPDYDMSIRDVFVDFAICTIKAAQQPRDCCGSGVENPYHFDCCSRGWKDKERCHRVMTMLCCAGSLNQQHDLPSWVPDWSLTPKVRPLCFWAAKTCRAGGDIPGEICIRLDERLQLQGKVYDTINIAGVVDLDLAGCSDAKAERQLVADWNAECEQIARRVLLPYPTSGKPASKVLQQIFTQNNIHCKHANPPDPQQRRLRQHRRSSGNLIDDLSIPPGELPKNHFSSAMGIAVGRVLVLTGRGFLGLAPHGTREGDVVFVMLGCDIPFILRPAGDEFVLLGECLVQGIMDGEAMGDEQAAVRDHIIR